MRSYDQVTHAIVNRLFSFETTNNNFSLKKDCEDGSDEVQSPSGMAKKKERKCPDGKEKRTSRNSLLYGEVRFADCRTTKISGFPQIQIIIINHISGSIVRKRARLPRGLGTDLHCE